MDVEGGSLPRSLAQIRSGSNSGWDKEGAIKPKDFWWDRFIKFLAATIALGTGLETALQFLANSGPSCTATVNDTESTYDISRDDVAYINRFCQQSLSRAAYYPLFLFSQSIALTAPDFIWGALFVNHFDHFFRVVKELYSFRAMKKDPEDKIKILKSQFGYTVDIFRSYIIKLLFQMVVVLTSFGINIFVFPFKHFNVYFICPVGCDISIEGWQFLFCVSCVYPLFRLYQNFYVIDFIILSAALLILSMGIVWCFAGHEASTSISTFTVIPPTHYISKEVAKSNKTLYITRMFCSIPPEISDLEFLELRLLNTDSGYREIIDTIEKPESIQPLRAPATKSESKELRAPFPKPELIQPLRAHATPEYDAYDVDVEETERHVDFMTADDVV